MSATAFIEQLGSVGPHRMRDLHAEGTISAYYVLVNEDRPAGVANHAAWHECESIGAGNVPRYAWWVAGPDQALDVAIIDDLDFDLNPTGWVLNIEKPLEGASLEVLLKAVSALGKPIVASLGGFHDASHANLDFRSLDKHGAVCNWQAYFDSGEGPTPAEAVQELYQSSFVIPGWEYRHRWGATYGWGKVGLVSSSTRAAFNSYKRPGSQDAFFDVSARGWGFDVVDRTLARDEVPVGVLMGRAAYLRIAVTLDVTRTAQTRPPAEWTPIAASARVPGAARRPVSIYLLDNCSDDVARAIAAGAP